MRIDLSGTPHTVRAPGLGGAHTLVAAARASHRGRRTVRHGSAVNA